LEGGARRRRCTLAPVTTWDYTTTVITHGFMGRKEEELDRKEFETALSELGTQGWELATVFLDVSLHREKDGHVLVFKRRND
jgi:hypothetical protein